MHPYGCEAETSLQELFDFFTRCLQNAEWELAGACVPQLCDAGGEVSQRLRDIIKAIITYPYPLDPHKLAWLWLQVLEKWTKEEVPVSVRRELEFLLLLEELGDEVPETTLKVYTSYFLKKSHKVSFKLIFLLFFSLNLFFPAFSFSSPPFLFLPPFPFPPPFIPVDLPEAEKLLLGLCCHGDRPSVWKTIYFECLSSGKHFLERVLVTALDLVKREEFCRLEDLLKGEFQPLSRLLLLLGWTQCQSLLSAQTLLRLLHHDQALANDSVLREFANGLSSQLGVLEWCVENNLGIPKEALLGQLHTLDSHSALYVLHCLTPLAQNEEHMVLDLLNTQTKPSGADEQEPRASFFWCFSESRNLVLYRGFCAMKYALYAMCITAHKYSGCSDCGTAQSTPEAEKDQSQASTPLQDCPPLFQLYLSECQIYLEAVPAMFRLELLENIFSLLFLSIADFTLHNHQGATTSTGQTEHSEGKKRKGQEEKAEVVGRGEEDQSKMTKENHHQPPNFPFSASQRSHLDLGHLTAGCRGFLVDLGAMEGFLRLLRESLEGVVAEAAESLGCSVTAETFGARLQRLSKRTAEAQWRLQIITSNQDNGNGKLQPVTLTSTSTRKLAEHSGAGRSEWEVCPCGSMGSWVVPAMLSPPESLLMACIRRGNYMEAHQVSLMFGLEGSWCFGELVFMERYREVLEELGRVEQKMETHSLSSSSSSSEGLGATAVAPAPGRSRLGSSGRSTLQAIGSAAAAGMAFYSVSDVADRLLSTPGRPVPSLEEGYWLGRCVLDPPGTGLLHTLLEELSPPAMAAFDLACCHCQLWKTSRQLLDTAERRLHSSLEGRGRWGTVVLGRVGYRIEWGKSIVEDHVVSSPLGCCIHEVLLCCHPVLSEEGIATRLSLAQHLEITLLTLSTATETTGIYHLAETTGIYHLADPVHHYRNHRYISPYQNSEVKLGNPLLVLLQAPSQLLSHLLFERQVAPDRVLSLLQQEGLRLSVQQVIVQRCCEPQSQSPSSESEASPALEDLRATTPPVLILSSSLSPPRPTSSSSSFLLTPSALSFLKSRSPLLATIACLSASPRGAARVQPSGWLVFRGGGRKECVLDGEQISREGESLLRDFPILRAYLGAMAQPVLGTSLGAGEDGPLVVLLLSGPQGTPAQAVAMEAFQQALASRDLGRALSLLELYGQGCSQERVLQDRLLAWAALEGQLFRVQDPCLRARVALQALERWPLGPSLELMEFCLNNPHMEASLRGELELRKTELDIYQRVNFSTNFLMDQTNQKMLPLAVHLMISSSLCQEFSLCAQWMALYSVSDHLRLQLQTEHLLHLLEKGQTDNAFQLLEGLSDLTLGLEVCERALDRRPGLAACHFLANYLTLHFQCQVSPARRRHIHDLHLGSKVLLTLPPGARQDYFPLLSEPLLMLEQLLMNLKVDWAEVAVRTLQNLLLGREDGFTTHDIDKLLSKYACKALDFPYAPREKSRSDSVISLQDDQCPAQDSCPSTPSRMGTPPPTAGSTPMHTSSSSSSLDRGSTGRRIQRSPDQFQPPDRAPVRKDWVPDNQQHVCMVCQRERFTMFNRRHHCRRCGRLVCHACSDHKMAVEGCTEEEKEVRVCDQCYSYFHPDPMSTEGVLDSMLHLPEVTHRQFHLSTNPTDNLQLQTDFYYEQAPSASLCVAILSLHSDQTACGHQLIGHCRSLSRKLTNPEVDARLLTDVMRQLLFSAKLMFVKVGRSQDLALCDSYISKVDVLKILVTANYKYIPCLDDILETAAVTRLRNQLLEAEYYQLAVEVSTKSGLDPGGVWQAWGMASLKAGNLTAAREKLCRCLKAPVDRNQLNLGPRLLQEIVSHLESTVRSTLSFSEDILWSLRELEEALCEPGGSVDWPEGVQGQGNRMYQESLYYLSSYGTHLALVSFLMRHDNMKDALQHLLSKECPEEVFLEGVLQPSLERGRLGMLQGLLETLDPGLEVCSRYLLSSCQLLQRRGHFHTLYQLQQFMMDHVRAAMTCIRFFTHGVVSYVQLGDQRRWLVRAKEHLRTYLQEQQGTRTNSTNRKKSTSNSFRKKMSSSDVSRHMNTIELQLEVTRFLHHCETSSSAPSASSSTPPTLFGPSAMKIDVACKVMLGGKNIEEGFGIAYRVIQDFQLEALTVYVRAGQRLVRQRQYRAVRQLLKCVGESGTATKNDCDVIILSCAKELECLILETKSTENKIKAYLQVSKLRAAYLLAVKLDTTRAGPLVQEVLQTAEAVGDSVMQDICLNPRGGGEHGSCSLRTKQDSSNQKCSF
uniref:Zinc finger FYVE domain-containing protein 26 n=1 Tax=Oncorhynchus kisutch TaxID=8019 RepID=A0A8C7CZW9_ONCKI